MTGLWILAAAVLIVNLPFGYWRSGLRKFSLAWFVAVHGPVPVIVALRIGLGVGWRLSTLPILVGAYVTGQLLGANVRSWRKRDDS